MDRFQNLGVIKNAALINEDKVAYFSSTINLYKQNKNWTKEQLVTLFAKCYPTSIIKKQVNI